MRNPPGQEDDQIATVNLQFDIPGHALECIHLRQEVGQQVVREKVFEAVSLNHAIICKHLPEKEAHEQAGWIPGRGARGFGWMSALVAFGNSAGALTLGYASKRSALRQIGYLGALGMLIAGIAQALVGVSPTLFLTTVASGLTGFFMAWPVVLFRTGLQTLVPSYLQGRVISVTRTVTTAVTPLGMMLAGGLADRLSAVAIMGMAGVLMTFVGFAALFVPEYRDIQTPSAAQAS